jgi:hypothetical protein
MAAAHAYRYVRIGCPEAKELVEAEIEAVVEDDAGWTEEQQAELILASALFKIFEPEQLLSRTYINQHGL